VTADFFDSFRQDYGGGAFDKWFARKADEDERGCRSHHRGQVERIPVFGLVEKANARGKEKLVVTGIE
jgi:hypothetical protein